MSLDVGMPDVGTPSPEIPVSKWIFVIWLFVSENEYLHFQLDTSTSFTHPLCRVSSQQWGSAVNQTEETLSFWDV